MTRDDIIRMAREAGYTGLNDPWLHTFAALVAAQEREACAEVCESQITGSDFQFLATRGHWDHMAQAATNCAAAIRARGQT